MDRTAENDVTRPAMFGFNYPKISLLSRYIWSLLVFVFSMHAPKNPTTVLTNLNNPTVFCCITQIDSIISLLDPEKSLKLGKNINHTHNFTSLSFGFTLS